MAEPKTPMSTLASQICNQIASVFSKPSPSPPPLDLMVNEISAASARKARIFLYGVGREGLMLKALCMRLAHLGLSAHSVFDMTTPPISSPDLPHRLRRPRRLLHLSMRSAGSPYPTARARSPPHSSARDRISCERDRACSGTDDGGRSGFGRGRGWRISAVASDGELVRGGFVCFV
ncbi:sugar isomerase (SIS) family protein [Actinidia rufa]|uniref:Sugar isomerase (SIS) family protein n=1 Tax=Actinidia rufa TaxID=165716 RepID=A0A7J0E680_9ERIC|nr:sugar isomerase (SIS) family protein [Actinidia rufa]